MRCDETTPWVEGLTIDQTLRRTAVRCPDQDALVFPALGLRRTWPQLEREVEKVARGLRRLGLRRGDHVAIWAGNHPEWFVLQLATARIGSVLVTINPSYRVRELRYVLRQSDAKAIFLSDRFKSSDYAAMLSEACPELAHCQPGHLLSEEFPKLRWAVMLTDTALPGSITWREMVRGVEEGEEVEESLRPDDPINIQYTSGTTGHPKAAVLTHRNLLLNAYHIGCCQRFSQYDRICLPVPFYHCFGCVLGNLCAVVHGAAVIVPASTFAATATLSAIEEERATAIYGVPTMFIAMLQDPSFEKRDLVSLRTGIMAGSPCPIEVMRQVIDRMGAAELTIAYGLTEASPVLTQTRTSDPLELRVETVGRPLPGVELRIADPETGRDCGDGRPGELWARGHGVMQGYYKDPEATQAAIDSQGWLRTGDLGLRRSDGYYEITGRLKDMVIRGGENIYPREIEEYLFGHPAVEQAAVVGVPDSFYGEELCAWIQLKEGESCSAEDIRDYCRSGLARYKSPRYVKFVDSFPQTVTGKIQKFKIRRKMIEELKLEA